MHFKMIFVSSQIKQYDMEKIKRFYWNTCVR